MNTEQVIAALLQDGRPVPRGSVGRRVAWGALAGTAVAALVTVLALGLRPDLRAALGGVSFWMKWAYCGSLGLGALLGVAELAQPGRAVPRRLWLLCLPVLALAALSARELAVTPAQSRLALWLGASWSMCPRIILMLAAPVFLGLLWSLRRLAPTRLRTAGAVSGMCAGAWAAFVYCLHCPEVSATFVLTWYSLGIALAAGVGALLGPKLMRW